MHRQVTPTLALVLCFLLGVWPGCDSGSSSTEAESSETEAAESSETEAAEATPGESEDSTAEPAEEEPAGELPEAGSGLGTGLGSAVPTTRGEVTHGTPSIIGRMQPAQVSEVVEQHARGIRYCYERDLAANPSMEGRIVVRWTIAADGSTTSRSIERSTLETREIESCLLREVNRMRFPATDDGSTVDVSFPFDVAPQGE